MKQLSGDAIVKISKTINSCTNLIQLYTTEQWICDLMDRPWILKQNLATSPLLLVNMKFYNMLIDLCREKAAELIDDHNMGK
jgi:hypothetical protein